MKKDVIKSLVVCAALYSVFTVGCGASDNNRSTNSANTSEPTVVQETPVEQVVETSSDSIQIDENNDNGTALLGENFDNALKDIGMDPSKVKNLKNIDDWASGKRYSFIYDGYEYIAYVLDNGEINSICNGNLMVKIYERGYQPLNYKDFEPDASIIDSLMETGLKTLAKYILNEETLRTKLGTTTFYRIYDYYSFTGDVVAKNDVDKDEFTFTVDLVVDGDSAKVTYISIDGVTQYGSQDAIPEIEKEEISGNGDGNSEGTANKIVISDGKLGEYGKEDLFDGDEYIRYYLPTGKYNVKCVVRGGFYIESISLHKEDGWDTATTYDEIMLGAGDETTITIEDGQCISLIINTELEFTPQ